MTALLPLLCLASAPAVALLSTSGDTTELRTQLVGDATLAPAVARFTHQDGSTVKGALLPDGRVVAAAVVGRPRDESFEAQLFLLEAGQPARVVARGLAVASRPVVLSDGRVFVQRGSPGEETERGRIDALTLDEVDVASGRARPIYAARGFTTFLAGAAGRELVVYEVGPDGARLLAVHVDTLAVRLLTALAPLAFDFTVDAARHRVVFTLGTPGAERWAVVSVGLEGGAPTTLARGPGVALVPAVLPDGRVLWAPGPGAGLRFAAGGQALPAQGPGFERVVATAGAVLLVLHETPGDFPRLVTRTLEGPALKTAFPAGARLDVAGVLP